MFFACWPVATRSLLNLSACIVLKLVAETVKYLQLAKFLILYRYGGLFLDLDIEIVRDLRPMLQELVLPSADGDAHRRIDLRAARKPHA